MEIKVIRYIRVHIYLHILVIYWKQARQGSWVSYYFMQTVTVIIWLLIRRVVILLNVHLVYSQYALWCIYPLVNHFCYFSIDATKPSDRLGRLVNDGIGPETNQCNSKMKKLEVDGVPCLVLFALKRIQHGEEILYDYGDDQGHLHWRKVSTCS